MNTHAIKTSSFRVAYLAGPMSALMALSFGTVNAQTSGSWTKTSTGTQDYETTANWLNGIVANGAGAVGTFVVAPAGNQIIRSSVSHTLGTMTLQTNGRSQTFSALDASQRLIFDNNGSTAQLTVNASSGNNSYIYIPVLLNSSLNISNNNTGGRSLNFQNNAVSSGTITNNTANALTITNNGTGAATSFDNIISDGTSGGTISLVQSSATSATLLTAANTFSGSTTNTSGLISLGNILALQNSALNTTASIVGNNVAAGNGLKTKVTALTLGGLTGNKDFGTLFNTVVDASNLGYVAVTALTLNPGTAVTNSYSGAIANGAANMTLTKTGAGTQILSGASTYTGATNVNVGTLYVNGNQSSATGIVTVASAATLGGTGTIGGATTVQSGGTYSPGAISLSPLTQAANLSINAGGIFNWNNSAGNALGTAGTDWSVANITGASTLTLDGTANTGSKLKLSFSSSTDFNNSFWDANRSWNFITGGVSSAFDTSNISIFISGVQQGSTNTITGQGTFTTLVNGSNEQLVWTAAVAGVATAYWSGASSGNWGTVDNWNTTATSSTAIALVPDSSTDVHFSTTSPAPSNLGAVDLAANFAVKTLSFDAGSAAVTIGSANNSTLTIVPGSSSTGVSVDTAASDNTLNMKIALGTSQTWTVGASRTLSATNQISGGFNLTKAGAGTLLLGGINTYSGTTSITAGTLQIGAAGTLGSGTYAGAIAISSGALLRYSSSASQTFSGAISGQGGLTKDTSSTSALTLTNATNSYSGGTTVSSGTLNFSGFTSQPATGALAISSGATVNLSSLGAATATTPTVGVTGAGALNFVLSGGPANSNTLNYDLSGFTGTIDITGSGRLLMQSPFVSPAAAAKIVVENGTTAYLGFLSGTPTTLLCTVQLNGTTDAGENLGQLRVENNARQNGPVILNANSTIGSASGIGVIAGVISDGGLGKGFTKQGGGTLTLTNTNTYSSVTTISEGTLSVGTAANLGAAGANLVFDGGRLQITGTALTSFSGIGHAVSFNLNKNVELDVADANNTFTVDQPLNQGTGWFYKFGPGTAILNQVNTMMPSGGTNYNGVAEGTLLITKVAAMPGLAADLWYADAGATLAVRALEASPNGEFTSANLDTLLGGGSTTDAFDTGSNLGIEVTASNNFTYANDIGGTSYSATDFNKGLVKLGTGTLTLTGINSYTGPTTISAGTLQLGDGTSGNDGTIATSSGIVNNGTLIYNRFGNLSSSVAISGTGAVVKQGVGSQTLNATNTYTGPTNIQAGTLALGATGSINNSSLIALSPGATFDVSAVSGYVLAQTLTAKGSGTANVIGAVIAGAKTLDLKDGINIGTLALSSDLSLNGATLTFDLSSTTSDQIAVTGVATVAGTNTINVAALTAASGLAVGTHAYTLLTAGSGLVSSNFTLSSTTATVNSTTYNFSLSGDATHEYLDVSAVSSAVSGIWAVNASGSYNTPGNWSGGVPGLGANSAGNDTATFAAAATTVNPIVTLDGVSPVLKGITFNNAAHGYTIAQGTGGTLTLNGGASPATVDVTSGSHTISAPLSLATNTNITLANAGSLTLSGAQAWAGHNVAVSGAGTITISGTQSNASPATFTVNSGVVANINTDGGTGLSLVNTGVTNLKSSQTLAGVTINSGAHVNVTTNTAQPVATGPSVLVTPTLSIASHVVGSDTIWDGYLDLANNKLVVQTGGLSGTALQAAVKQVASQVRSGYNLANGSSTLWMGTGIGSSSAAADTRRIVGLAVFQNNTKSFGSIDGTVSDGTGNAFITTPFGGATVAKNDTLVKFTYFGDTDLDGVITAGDYANIDLAFAHQQTLGPQSGWANGDFDYDGSITAADYSLMDSAFAAQSGALAEGVHTLGGSLSGSLGSVTAVPEPSTWLLGLLGIIGLLTMARRRRLQIAK